MSAAEELPPSPGRGVFCNRTLNLRSIRAVGYDMDYTLVHYRVEAWEQRAYEAARRWLLEQGWPVEGLRFQPELVIRGLAIDIERGNLVKANRFGYVKRAVHGTRPLDWDAQRQLYAHSIVELGEARFVFLNTLFSLSEGCLYSQLVDLLDRGSLSGGRLPGVMGYADLWQRVSASINAAHLEGELKAEIVAEPERFVVLDPDVPRTLLDQRQAGKKLLLVTNSEWSYTDAILRWSLERYLPAGQRWRDLFDLVIVGARKPAFFNERSAPLFEVVSDEGLLRPARRMGEAGRWLGGCAALVEEQLGLSGDQILYVGDHLFSDVFASKNLLRWRTALILRELEAEVEAVAEFRPRELELEALMLRKAELELRQSRARLELQRAAAAGQCPDPAARARPGALQAELDALDATIAPLARAAAELGSKTWGLLLRTGNDKSLLARQLERHADLYTSRVSNFLGPTPFAFFRSPRGSLPHDPA